MGSMGGGQAFSIEQQALALIAALGGKKETAEHIKAFSEARQRAEKSMEALVRERTNLDEYKSTLDDREKELYVRSGELDRLEAEHKERFNDLENRSTVFTTWSTELELTLSTREKQLVEKEKDLEKKCKEKEEEIRSKEGKAIIALGKIDKAQKDAEVKLAEAEATAVRIKSKLKRLEDIAKE